MKTLLVLATLIALALVPSPVTATAPCDDDALCGIVLVGSGRALAEDIDHVRHAIPEDAVGIVVETVTSHDPRPHPGGLRFARFTSCPPAMACVLPVVDLPCLLVHATPGAGGLAYRLRWTADAAEAHVLLAESPSMWAPPAAPGAAPATAAC